MNFPTIDDDPELENSELECALIALFTIPLDVNFEFLLWPSAAVVVVAIFFSTKDPSVDTLKPRKVSRGLVTVNCL